MIERYERRPMTSVELRRHLAHGNARPLPLDEHDASRAETAHVRTHATAAAVARPRTPDAARALARLYGYGVVVRHVPARDPLLHAVDHVLVAVPHCRRCNASHIGSCDDPRHRRTAAVMGAAGMRD
jgi:hypothetical protein